MPCEDISVVNEQGNSGTAAAEQANTASGFLDVSASNAVSQTPPGKVAHSRNNAHCM